MTDLHPYMKAQLKAVLSAETEPQIIASDQILVSAQEILNLPLTILTAWPYPSDYGEYEHYAYVHIRLNSGERIVRVGGNAGRQALWLESHSKLPSQRTLKCIGNLYFWKRHNTE